MKPVRRMAVMVGLLILLLSSEASADAIVVSRAMFADTIAEYFVENDHIRVELEIGAANLDVFRNLMPDGIYEQFGYPPRAQVERINEFFARDLVIMADGKTLQGGIAAMGPETRVQRDAVTGEALTTGEDESEVVIAATLIYPFTGLPESLTLIPPSQTGTVGIGFVLYHHGVAVNDFRFLSPGSTVDLDWEDPWYSTFRTRSMRRQYFSPMAGFIYVEPFEVRKEIILRPKDMQRWTDLGLAEVDTITPDMQPAVKAGIIEFLQDKFQVRIDGVPVEGTIDRVNFLARTLRSSVVVDNQDIDLLPATLGVIYVFPTDGLPQKVEMEWDLFTERMQMVPVSAVDQAGALPGYVEPDYNLLKWENFLKFPELPTLTEVRLPPTTLQSLARWGQWLFGAITLLSLLLLLRGLRSGRGMSRPLLASSVLFLVLAAWSVHTWSAVRMDSERLHKLVAGLLHNVYRAFDYRGEETVYDVLARSVTGDLLTDVYLETRKGLELANQGGAQVKVKNIEVLESKLLESAADRFSIEARWNVFGSVGHWGHVHQRTNAYHANITVADEEGAWKLIGLEILQEERL